MASCIGLSHNLLYDVRWCRIVLSVSTYKVKQCTETKRNTQTNYVTNMHIKNDVTKSMAIMFRSPFYLHRLTSVPARIINYTHYKVWGEIT